MKIESTNSIQMLHKGVMENTEKFNKGKETEREKSALETKSTIKTFAENKGVYLDTKA